MQLKMLVSEYSVRVIQQLKFNFLKARDDVLIIGPDEPGIRSSMVTIVPLKKTVATVATELEKHKLMVASGDFDATRIFNDMNIAEDPGAIILSFIHYTTQDDIDHGY